MLLKRVEKLAIFRTRIQLVITQVLCELCLLILRKWKGDIFSFLNLTVPWLYSSAVRKYGYISGETSNLTLSTFAIIRILISSQFFEKFWWGHISLWYTIEKIIAYSFWINLLKENTLAYSEVMAHRRLLRKCTKNMTHFCAYFQLVVATVFCKLYWQIGQQWEGEIWFL